MVSVAQLVEPRIVDPVVVGSSPIAHPRFAGPLAQLVEQLTLNQRVKGSSPLRPTRNKELTGRPRMRSIHIGCCKSAGYALTGRLRPLRLAN